MNFLNYFDHIYCINLLRRQDRWEESKANFSKLNIMNKIERIEGVDGNFLYPNVTGRSKRYVGIFGCNHSHLNIINDAIEKDYGNILILEDDVEFHNDFLNLFDQFSDQINFQWDLLYLGGNYRIIKNKIQQNVLQMEKVFTTHSYAISNNVYKILKKEIGDSINNYINNKRLGVIDVIISNLIKKEKLLCYGFYPKLTWQRTSYSDLRYAVKDYKVLRK
jgi:GR25 family glycosyltransferase involved in LPS biosynthesis